MCARVIIYADFDNMPAVKRVVITSLVFPGNCIAGSLSGELVQFAALLDTDIGPWSDGKLRALPLSQMLQMTTSM